MPNPFGLSFLPGTQDPGGARRGARAPVQEAIRILSLRLPKVFGAQALAPGPLLTGGGGMGQPAARGNVVAQALAQMAGLPPGMAFPSSAAPQPMGGTGGGGMVSPVPRLSAGMDTTEGWRQRERELNPATRWMAGLPPGYAPPPPRFIPGQDSGEGPTQFFVPPPPFQPSLRDWPEPTPLPALPGGGEKTDTTEGWRQQERGLNRPLTPDDLEALFNAFRR